MSDYSFAQQMETMHCYKCGIAFGMTQECYEIALESGKSFFCTNGHGQVFTETENTILKKKLGAAQRNAQNAQHRALQAESLADRTSKQYHRIRDRIMAGVCPCCNRTFGNLARHMQSKHPEFSPGQRLKTMRDAFGLIQAALAEEMGVEANHISLFEHDKSVPTWAKETIEGWMSETLEQSNYLPESNNG